MILFKKATDFKAYIALQKQNNATIGFVPTMGALHDGHISLITKSKKKCTITACSIFVNPTQFNDKKDLEKYPRTIEHDIKVLCAAGCDALFFPGVDEVYPNGANPSEHYNLGPLEYILEGAYRPGHFQGVCQVVKRLFEITKPHHVFFGQKDYQQCMVIQHLINTTPQFGNIAMHIIPTLREDSGVAMSSRNMRLTGQQKEIAAAMYQTLAFIKNNIKPGNTNDLVERAKTNLIAKGFKPDYVSIADAQTLQRVVEWDGQTRLVALVAAYLGEVRLIDNMLLQ